MSKVEEMQARPTDRLLRVKQIIPDIVPMSKASWWAGVKAGLYPAPVKVLGPRMTVWRERDILNFINGEK